MKKVVFLLAFSLMLGILFVVLKSNNKNEAIVEKEEKKVLGFPSEEKGYEDISYDGTEFRVGYFLVNDASRIYLYKNSDNKTSYEFKKDENCEFLINGGYYKADHTLTGLVISEYEKLYPYVNSSLSNAVFSINDFATPRITKDIPEDRLRVAMQVGPMIKENGSYVKLNLKKDEEARRSIAAVTGDNQAVFLSIYKKDSVYFGPYLEKVSEILKEFEEKSQISLADAMNLDGGTASTFISDDLNLPEASFVGTFICIK